MCALVCRKILLVKSCAEQHVHIDAVHKTFTVALPKEGAELIVLVFCLPQ